MREGASKPKSHNIERVEIVTRLHLQASNHWLLTCLALASAFRDPADPAASGESNRASQTKRQAVSTPSLFFGSICPARSLSTNPAFLFTFYDEGSCFGRSPPYPITITAAFSINSWILLQGPRQQASSSTSSPPISSLPSNMSPPRRHLRAQRPTTFLILELRPYVQLPTQGNHNTQILSKVKALIQAIKGPITGRVSPSLRTLPSYLVPVAFSIHLCSRDKLLIIFLSPQDR